MKLINRISELSNELYTKSSTRHLKVTQMKSLRSISVVISGSQNEILCKTQSFNFTDLRCFESYIGPFLTASKGVYPLTNRSTIDSTLVNIFYMALVFPLLFTSSCYDYIHDNQKTYSLPVGIARVLDYACVKTSKYSTSGNLGSLNGMVISTYNLSSTIDFIESNFLETIGGKGLAFYSDNIKLLSQFVGSLGYTVTAEQLYNILSALVIELKLLNKGENIYDFDRMLTTISRISTSLVKLPVIQYHTLRSSSQKVGIYKFRNSSREGVYHVSPKGFDSMDVSSQQASFIFLALFQPTFVTNGVAGPNINAEDLNLDSQQHVIVNVLSALFSFEAQAIVAPNIAGNPDGDADPLVRAFSTQAGPSRVRNNLPNIRQWNGAHYHRCNIFCTKPLVLTLEQAFGPS